jgi:hypothetical protein
MTPEAVIAEFEPPKKSIRWAQSAVEELRASITAFFDGRSTEIVTEVDSQTGEHVQKIRLVRALPDNFARKATEALVNARHAFDQALFAARNLVSGRSSDSIYYPWTQTPTDLSHLLRTRGIDQRLWDTIKGHEPYPRSQTYPGGNDLVRVLASMANDKHTVGLSIGGTITRFRHPDVLFGGNPPGSFVEISTPRWDPKKNEAETIRWKGDDITVTGYYRADFEVLLQDPRLPQSVNVARGLTEFAEKAKTVVETLQARCLELVAP